MNWLDECGSGKEPLCLGGSCKGRNDPGSNLAYGVMSGGLGAVVRRLGRLGGVGFGLGVLVLTHVTYIGFISDIG